MATQHSTSLAPGFAAYGEWLPHSTQDVEFYKKRFGFSTEVATTTHFIEREIYEWSRDSELSTAELARALGWHPALVRACGHFGGDWLFAVGEDGLVYAGDVAAHLARCIYDDRYAAAFNELREWAIQRCLDRLEGGAAPTKEQLQ
jgi:hypothetical protein